MSCACTLALVFPPLPSLRTVMKSGSELVKAGFRAFFENAAEDLEKLLEMLKLGKFMQSRAQMKSVTQSINYVTVALLPILTALFEHIKTHEFGTDLLCEFLFPYSPFHLDYYLRKKSDGILHKKHNKIHLIDLATRDTQVQTY